MTAFKGPKTQDVSVTGTVDVVIVNPENLDQTMWAAVAVTDALTAINAPIVGARQLRFCNIGSDPVAIGTASLTWAKRNIVLNPGDMWIESDTPEAQWYGICDATKTASVTMASIQ